MAKPTIIQRVGSAARLLLTGNLDAAFMGPAQPIQPSAPEGTAGRQWDYRPALNLNYLPRAAEKTGFAELRHLADGLDLLRLVIETRKDQLAAFGWTVRIKDEEARKKQPSDPRIKAVTTLLEMPDGEHDWDTWLRMLVEDMLVLDAASIYPERTRGGDLRLSLIDGATIHRVIDARGRTPLPPQPAYQQILHGTVAGDFTRDELLYLPRNPRTNRLYGYSPVEQVKDMVQIAIERQGRLRDYFREGTVPDAISGVPDSWNADQIHQFQDYFDSLLSGDQAALRRVRFLPDTAAKTFKETKGAILKDELDEWLARIVCYAFSVSSQPFVKQMNRATAETSVEQALQEGLTPLKGWVCRAMNRVLAGPLGYPDLEFVYTDQDAEISQLEQANIDKIYLACGVKRINDVREQLGMDPDPLGGELLIETGSGAVRLADVLEPPPQPTPLDAMVDPQMQAVAERDQPQPGAQTAQDPKPDAPAAPEPAAKKEGADAVMRKVAAHYSSGLALAMVQAETLLARAMTDMVPSVASRVAAALAARGLTKADQIGPDQIGSDQIPQAPSPSPVPDAGGEVATGSGAAGAAVADATVESTAIQVLEVAVDEAPWRAAIDHLQAIMAEIAQDGAAAAIDATPVPTALPAPAAAPSRGLALSTRSATSLANPRAVAWADAHAAELVTNVTQATRDMLRATIVQAEAEGWSVERLTKEIASNHAFSRKRARLIARTELKSADSMGNVIGWRAMREVSGLDLRKAWMLGNEGVHCASCIANHDAGPIDLDDEFPSGQQATPGHPHCDCYLTSALGPFDDGEARPTDGPFDLAKYNHAHDSRGRFAFAPEGKGGGGSPYDAHKEAARGREAMQRVLDTKGDVHGAMNARGLGLVDFIHGTPGTGPKLKKGYGVSHLVARRIQDGEDGQAIAMKMPDVIAHGSHGEAYGPTGARRVNFNHEGHTAVLSESARGGTWLLTGWKDHQK